MGGGHICGNNFFRKYAPPQKFSPQNVQIYVIFLHLKCHFFCDVNKLPNLHDYVKTSQKNSLRKHRENFFRKYAPLFIEGGGIIAEITVPSPLPWMDKGFSVIDPGGGECYLSLAVYSNFRNYAPPPSMKRGAYLRKKFSLCFLREFFGLVLA